MINQQRAQLQFKTEIDLDKGDVSGFLGLTWFFGEGRGLRDFRPAEEDFRDVKDWRVPQVVNNRIAPPPESWQPVILPNSGAWRN